MLAGCEPRLSKMSRIGERPDCGVSISRGLTGIVVLGTMTVTRSETAPSSEIGVHRKRIEDPRLLRGEGQYVDDLRLENVAEVAFVRSAHAHARIVAIHVEAARQAPG